MSITKQAGNDTLYVSLACTASERGVCSLNHTYNSVHDFYPSTRFSTNFKRIGEGVRPKEIAVAAEKAEKRTKNREPRTSLCD